MTNSEYFEKNKISFAEAMEIFNKQKANGTKSFDTFLTFEHVEHKFNVGDIVVLQRDRVIARKGNSGWMHDAVLKVVKIGDLKYAIEFLTPDGSDYIGCVRDIGIEFIDNCCVLY